jgi:hypothetical protein
MYRQAILQLIEDCKEAHRRGIALSEIRNSVLTYKINLLVREIDTNDLLEWLKQDRQYSYYYYTAQQSGVCAKPREAAASILESVVMDAIDEDDEGFNS